MIPLQYASLRILLSYMDVNQRIQLSKRCPSLTRIEKDVSLKIQHLEFQNLQTVVNDTCYKLSVYRHYPPGVAVPRGHLMENDEGGVPADLDEFGFKETSRNTPVILTPGDVSLYSQLAEQTSRYGPEYQIVYRFRLCEEVLAIRQERDPIVVHHWLLYEEYYQKRWTSLFEDRERDELLKMPVDQVQRKRDVAEVAYLPFYYRKNSMSPPYTPLLQLTIESPDGRKIERYPYNLKLQEALKMLNEKLLGGRSQVIPIGKVVVKKIEVLRLPIGLKMSSKALEMGSSPFKAVSPLLDPSSFPLSHLQIINASPIDIYGLIGNRHLRNAQNLIFETEEDHFDKTFCSIVKRLLNPNVAVKIGTHTKIYRKNSRDTMRME